MGFNDFFSELACDVRDTANVTGKCPPFTVELAERDGRVWLSIGHAGDNLRTLRQAGLTPDQAKRLVLALREAIRDAELE